MSFVERSLFTVKYIKDTNTHSEQNAEFLHGRIFACGTDTNHWALGLVTTTIKQQNLDLYQCDIQHA
jgi:hypothetical protein